MNSNTVISKLKKTVVFIVTFICILLGPGFGQVNKIPGYATVHGLKMYYDVYGSGKPLVLLPGAFNTIDMAFGMLIPA